eukprot:gnl/Carplike_NY0171/4942_a6736_304.p1 GENE.gnl/Carplike_NY0171/4942_a6736_304~~gnl/Carplike_NY0171/4942_a6736_304.p1  ORF type:complete len:349 (+),score=75.03 gnl/Carplike_NY0171/4942_a6736_304:29-1075(+)
MGKSTKTQRKHSQPILQDKSPLSKSDNESIKKDGKGSSKPQSNPPVKKPLSNESKKESSNPDKPTQTSIPPKKTRGSNNSFFPFSRSTPKEYSFKKDGKQRLSESVLERRKHNRIWLVIYTVLICLLFYFSGVTFCQYLQEMKDSQDSLYFFGDDFVHEIEETLFPSNDTTSTVEDTSILDIPSTLPEDEFVIPDLGIHEDKDVHVEEERVERDQKEEGEQEDIHEEGHKQEEVEHVEKVGQNEEVDIVSEDKSSTVSTEETIAGEDNVILDISHPDEKQSSEEPLSSDHEYTSITIPYFGEINPEYVMNSAPFLEILASFQLMSPIGAYSCLIIGILCILGFLLLWE